MSERLGQKRIREAVESALGVRLTAEERAILDGRLRFNRSPAWSQQQVADALGLSQPYISNIERGLVKKLEHQAERRQGDRTRAAELHKHFEAIREQLGGLEAALPPKPLKFRLKKRSASPA